MNLVDLSGIEETPKRFPSSFDENVRHPAFAQFRQGRFDIQAVTRHRNRDDCRSSSLPAVQTRNCLLPSNYEYWCIFNRLQNLAVFWHSFARRRQYNPRGHARTAWSSRE